MKDVTLELFMPEPKGIKGRAWCIRFSEGNDALVGFGQNPSEALHDLGDVLSSSYKDGGTEAMGGPKSEEAEPRPVEGFHS